MHTTKQVVKTNSSSRVSSLSSSISIEDDDGSWTTEDSGDIDHLSSISAANDFPILPLAPLSVEHRHLVHPNTIINSNTADGSRTHNSITNSAPLWVERPKTFEDRNTLRKTQALRALRTQLMPAGELGYRSAQTASSSVSNIDPELASLNPRDMTDAQLVRWRKLQHEDQWARYGEVERKRCQRDFLYHFMFSNVRADVGDRCLRYFRLLSAVENLVIGRYGSYLAPDIIARWRWYAIPPNWSPRQWKLAVTRVREQIQSRYEEEHKKLGSGAPVVNDAMRMKEENQAVDQLIDSWLRAPKTAPSMPSYTKKQCEEWLLLSLIVHVPEFSAYLLADPPKSSSLSKSQSSSQSLLVDRRGASMILLTGDGRQVNKPGHSVRFWSIAQLWMRVAQGRPMDPAVPPLAHTNRSILEFTKPSPNVYCGPFTPLIATTMAPHEHTMAATPFAVVRYFIEQYTLVTRVLAPQTAHVSHNTGAVTFQNHQLQM
jgi:hypothetical protein